MSLNKETTKVVLWQIRQTEKAYLFSRMEIGRDPVAFDDEEPPDKDNIWIPKSIIHHISRDKPDEHGVCRCAVEVELWFAEKNDL